jgi:hypothetical protein
MFAQLGIEYDRFANINRLGQVFLRIPVVMMHVMRRVLYHTAASLTAQ